MSAMRALADKHGLKIITDAAQAPGALYRGKFAGTLADVGGFSLNYHKHIHTGEGGIVVTNSDEIAERTQLIRNHAEAVVDAKGVVDLRNMVGHNLRLGEIEAAIGIEQLKKLKRLVAGRQRAAARLTNGLRGLSGLRTPVIRSECTHVYYVYPIVLDLERLGTSRAHIVAALQAEGVPGLAAGYECTHLYPLYQKKIAYGSKGFPWSSDICKRDVNYQKGICPVAEKLHDENFVALEMCLHELNDHDIDLIVTAFHAVWGQLESLA
jgi:dTDP-4-amino-4,6-dideoxygalactose transaminase